jgi:hypothetical protein
MVSVTSGPASTRWGTLMLNPQARVVKRENRDKES